MPSTRTTSTTRSFGRRVLLAAATSEGLQAAGRMAGLFGTEQGEVVVFRVDEVSASMEAERDDRDRWQQRVALLQRELNVPVRLVSQHAACPGSAILQAALAEGSDLIVMTPHQRRGLGRLLLGSVTEELIRRSDLAVLCVPFETAAARLERVLLATELDPVGVEALRWATALAREHRAEVDVVTLLPDLHHPTPHEAFEAGPRQDPDQENTRKALAELRNWVRAHAPEPLIASTTVLVGDPTTEVLDRAHRLSADLVILPNRGPDSRDAFIGSMTERVLRRSHCAVLVAGIDCAKTPHPESVGLPRRKESRP